jgi:hypothetical protein
VAGFEPTHFERVALLVSDQLKGFILGPDDLRMGNDPLLGMGDRFPLGPNDLDLGINSVFTGVNFTSSELQFPGTRGFHLEPAGLRLNDSGLMGVLGNDSLPRVTDDSSFLGLNVQHTAISHPTDRRMGMGMGREPEVLELELSSTQASKHLAQGQAGAQGQAAAPMIPFDPAAGGASYQLQLASPAERFVMGREPEILRSSSNIPAFKLSVRPAGEQGQAAAYLTPSDLAAGGAAHQLPLGDPHGLDSLLEARLLITGINHEPQLADLQGFDLESIVPRPLPPGGDDKDEEGKGEALDGALPVVITPPPPRELPCAGEAKRGSEDDEGEGVGRDEGRPTLKTEIPTDAEPTEEAAKEGLTEGAGAEGVITPPSPSTTAAFAPLFAMPMPNAPLHEAPVQEEVMMGPGAVEAEEGKGLPSTSATDPAPLSLMPANEAKEGTPEGAGGMSLEMSAAPPAPFALVEQEEGGEKQRDEELTNLGTSTPNPTTTEPPPLPALPPPHEPPHEEWEDEGGEGDHDDDHRDEDDHDDGGDDGPGAGGRYAAVTSARRPESSTGMTAPPSPGISGPPPEEEGEGERLDGDLEGFHTATTISSQTLGEGREGEPDNPTEGPRGLEGEGDVAMLELSDSQSSPPPEAEGQGLGGGPPDLPHGHHHRQPGPGRGPGGAAGAGHRGPPRDRAGGHPAHG